MTASWSDADPFEIATVNVPEDELHDAEAVANAGVTKSAALNPTASNTATMILQPTRALNTCTPRAAASTIRPGRRRMPASKSNYCPPYIALHTPNQARTQQRLATPRT